MPEPPDFERLARQLILRVAAAMPHIGTPVLVDDIVKQLRLVWNARGAADCAALRLELTRAPTAQRTDGSLPTDVEQTLKALDAVEP